MQRLLLVRARLLPTEQGGRSTAIASRYCPNWDIGNTHEGAKALDSAVVFLEGRERLGPGEEGTAMLVPLVPHVWARVVPGMRIGMQEGGWVVGEATVLEVLEVLEVE